MKTFTIDGSWNQIKGKLRQRFAELTDEDLQFAEGKAEELFGRLQSRLHMTAEQLSEMLDDLKSEAEDAAETARGRFETVKEKISEVAGNVKARAAEKAEQLKEKAGEVYGDAVEKVRSWHEEAEDCVRAQPRTALVGALVAGFVLGLLVKR
jgi:uncharacterized protein YjbJ (UPF0337 family)